MKIRVIKQAFDNLVETSMCVIMNSMINDDQ